jgi:2-keto-3-deoxy-L-rhamnonate aldolase RhmA
VRFFAFAEGEEDNMARKIRSLIWVITIAFLLAGGHSYAEGGVRLNLAKKKIQEGGIVKGIYMAMNDPFIAMVVAKAGFDYLWIDLEHTSLGWRDAEAIIQAVSGTDIVPIIRVPWNRHYFIKRALDIGAKGVIVPMVNTRDDAHAAVQACRYPPQGIRGFGPFKAAFYWGLDTKEYIRVANEEIMVIIQVEHETAIANIDEILSVEGVDVAMIGPMDLSASMGFLGQPTEPEVLAAIDNVVAAGKRHKVALGTLALSPDAFKKCVEQGFQFLFVGSDVGILMQGVDHLRKAFQTDR